VNLHGNGSLSSAMLAENQDGTVALGNPRNRALNPRFCRRNQFSLPFRILHDCHACHKGARVYLLP
jgi:hypothetical protein